MLTTSGTIRLSLEVANGWMIGAMAATCAVSTDLVTSPVGSGWKANQPWAEARHRSDAER